MVFDIDDILKEYDNEIGEMENQSERKELSSFSPTLSQIVVRLMVESIKRNDQIKTLQELIRMLHHLQLKLLRRTTNGLSTILSATGMFLRIITFNLKVDDDEKFEEVRQQMLNKGEQLIRNNGKGQEEIINNFIRNYLKFNSIILIYSFDWLIIRLLLIAKSVYELDELKVIIISPNDQQENNARDCKKLLDMSGIDCEIIPFNSLGIIMSTITLVLLNSGVVTSTGGIINSCGTNTIAAVAKSYGRNVYVLAETFTFLKIFPLSQNDIPYACRYASFRPKNIEEYFTCRNERSNDEEQRVDYTSPSMITTLITDLGPITTSVVSAVLLRLYE
ncbi:hypothetical protein SNEBB_004058 [Seison nebaliae]|nr:hypothetical protein SNEBB_004058 [Seison nebaliae]